MQENSANLDLTDSVPQTVANTSDEQKLRVPKFLRKLHEIVQVKFISNTNNKLTFGRIPPFRIISNGLLMESPFS